MKNQPGANPLDSANEGRADGVKRRSIEARIAVEIGRLSREKPNWRDLAGWLDNFLDAERETIIREALPGLKPDGRGGFSLLRTCPKTGKLRRVDIAGDFSAWSIDGDSASTGVYLLLAALNGEQFGSDSGLALFVGAVARGLFPRKRGR